MFIDVKNISKTYSDRELFFKASFSVNPGQRLCLIGENGSGKSTLAKIVAGQIYPDYGDVIKQRDCSVGVLAQQLALRGDERTVGDLLVFATSHIQSLALSMKELEHLMKENTDPVLLEKYGEVQEQFLVHDGYSIEQKILEAKSNLGIEHLDDEQKIITLSGGEQTRLGLCVLVLQSPDVIILDEPTNNIDDKAIQWLTNWLNNFSGAALIVSHNRAFVNDIATSILFLDTSSKSVKKYSRSYDDFLLLYEKELKAQKEKYDSYNDELRDLRVEAQETAPDVGHKGSRKRDKDKFAKNFFAENKESAISRNAGNIERKISKLERVPVEAPPEPIEFKLPILNSKKIPTVIASIKNVGYELEDGEPILVNVSLDIAKDSRILIVGPNGSGKSTLLKMLLGEIKPLIGEVIEPNVRVGYLSQDAIMPLPNQRVWDNFLHGLGEEGFELRGWPMRYGLFTRDEMELKINELSAGQLRRLQLARLIVSNPEFLVLDEPTNHFSPNLCDAFENALDDFTGPIITTSHDRRFIEKFNGKKYLLKECQLTETS